VFVYICIVIGDPIITGAINNQLDPISIYIVYISVLLVVFHMMNEGQKLYL
jgi:uncharacterized membrane-anchored protein